MSEPGIGHNSEGAQTAPEKIRAFVERIERLEAEKKTFADDIKDVYAEAKGTGFDTKALRRLVALRRKDKDELAEQQAILETYLHAMGMDFLI